MKQFFTLTKDERRLFLWVVLIGFIAHGFAFLNQNFSHDSLTFDNDVVSMGLGRWLHFYFSVIHSDFYPPLVVGVLTLLFLGCAAIVFTRAFDLRHRSSAVLTGGVLVTAYPLTYTIATYIHMSDTQALGVLLCVLSLYFTVKSGALDFKGRRLDLTLYLGGAALLLCFAMAIYQVFMQFYLTLCLLYVLLTLLKSELKSVLPDLLKMLLVTLLAGLFYYLLTRVILFAAGVALHEGGYNSLGKAVAPMSIPVLWAYVKAAYLFALQSFWTPPVYLLGVVRVLSLILLLLGSLCVYLTLRYREDKLPRTALLLLCVLLWPLTADCVFVLSKGVMHEVMQYSFVLVWLLPLLLLDRCDGAAEFLAEHRLPAQSLNCLCCGAIGFFLYGNVMCANQAYLEKDLEAKASLTVAARMLYKLEDIKGYTPGVTPVCFIGESYFSPYFSSDRGLLPANERRVGFLGTLAFTYNMHQYFARMLGQPLGKCPYGPDQILATPELVKLPDYPSQGSIQVFNNIVFIKLSNRRW